MNREILICSDLDRTILPNGAEPESSQARPLLRKLAECDWVTLAYVSGRNLDLLQCAVSEFDIPVPAYAVGDVGATIYSAGEDEWELLSDWSAEIASDWQGKELEDLLNLMEDVARLQPQEAEKQNTYKASFYAPADTDREELLGDVEKILKRENVDAALIWSVDESRGVGLLDILPRRATKLHAVRFLMSKCGISEENTMFAGDSGNDLPALTSGLQSVLVANARDDLRREAIESLEAQGLESKLYLPKGGFAGMNGNYAAGVLEGAAHFFPEIEPLILH